MPDNPAHERWKGRIGTVLCGKWRVDDLLGVGGMSAVYLATHRMGKRVAIKIMHQELIESADVRARFLREAYVANRIDHAGAVSVMDDDVTQDGCPFLVMELLEGATVEAIWVQKGRCLPIGEVLSLADRLLDVLAAAHAVGVVHRDIKPENLFLTRSRELKVLDFGLARLAAPIGAPTDLGVRLGTPTFMPPEQAAGQPADERSDVWGVGATIFTLLTGRYVHEHRSVAEQLKAAMTQPAPPVAQFMPGLPKSFSSIIDRALAFSPSERWPSAREMQAALREARARGRPAQSSALPKLYDDTDELEQAATEVASRRFTKPHDI